MIEREVVQFLDKSTGPADGSFHGRFCFSQAEKQFLAVLREESRSSLDATRLRGRFGCYRQRCPNRIAIALLAPQTKNDGRRKFRHDVFQVTQARAIAIFQNNFYASVMIEICKRKRS